MASPRNFCRAALAAILVATSIPALQAQDPPRTVSSDQQRSDMMGAITGQLFSTDPNFAPPSPADNDLGEQRLLFKRDDYKAFTLFANASEFFTSNAALSHNNPRSDWFTAVQFGASYVPHITGGLYGEITAMQQLYRYADYSGLNFNSLDLGAGLIYVFSDLEGLSVFTRYNYNLLTDAEADSSLLYQQTIRMGVNKPFIFSRAHSATVGLAADINLDGWPDYALRNRFAALAGYQVNLTRLLQANLFYQLAYFPYLDTGRRDWNQILSASLVFNISPRFSISASVSGSFNDSNEKFYEYSVLNTGGGLSANYKF